MPPADEFYLKAFYELATGRNQDGRISWRDIDDFAERCGLDEEVVPAFREIIRALERTFGAWIDTERERLQRQAEIEAENKQGPRSRVHR